MSRTVAELLGLAVLVALGRSCADLCHWQFGAWLYWAGAAFLAGVCLWRAGLRRLVRWKWEEQLRATLPGLGGELSGLKAAALAIKEGHEERALHILESLRIKSGTRDVAKARHWLAGLARVGWLARQRPPRPLLAHHRFPQLHALVFSGGTARVPLRRESLLRELAEATPADLDALAREYISLHDVLVSSLGRSDSPFAAEAEEWLAFTTGRTCLLAARGHYILWWGKVRPVLARGGGAVLVGARLLQRGACDEAAQLLTGLAQDGVLSFEGDALRRAACFLKYCAWLPRPMTSSDIPRYFTEGHYSLALETGVLRFPTASLPEVVDCCRRGQVLRDSKRRLIEDALVLWERFDGDLAPQLAVLLKRLLEDRGRGCPARLSYWQRRWAECEPEYERAVGLLMDGVAAASRGRLAEAAQMFEEVARLEPESSLGLVNLVYVQFLAGRKDEAKALAAAIERRFPLDGHAQIALGRLFAEHLGDSAAAERLFLKALETIDPPTEALIRLGEVKLAQGSYMEAQAYFDQARRVDPGLPDPRLGLARTYMETRNHRQAIEHLRAVADTNFEEARELAHFLLYQVYRELGDDRQAFEYLDKVPPRFFQEPDILDDIAGHLESEHHYAKAREFSERAMLLRASGRGREQDPEGLGAL
ncbi:MAG: tetratricopeptide repeat protein [Planctomycetota bacterium]